MPHDVIMPALGMAQETGLIVAWHKSPGDPVAAGDVLFEVETDKATMEVEAQADGFLTQVRAHAGDDVPVGNVIAVIGETTEAVHTEESPAGAAPSAPELPEGQSVIMPALGMAQETGLIVAWHKTPGDAVASSDILFEVETDKSTVEVEAGQDGYVAALLAEAGEEAPVGETIAVISATKPDNPVQISRAGGGNAAPAPVPAAPAPVAATKPVVPAKPVPATPKAHVAAGGRVLASPKARRIALEEGLDLNRLVDAGHPQPFHVADLDALRSLPAETARATAPASRRLTALIRSEGFTDFASWAAQTAGLTDARALLAGLAGASLGRDAIIAVESFGESRSYAVPFGPFGNISMAEDGATPELNLRDLRFSRISGVEMGAEDVPVLTLTSDRDGLNFTLECASGSLGPSEAIALLSNFAGRMEQPLRHLL